MKIEKLPSGSYRMRKMYKGKTYTVVTDYKPTQKEAIQLMSEELDKVRGSSADKTFRNCAEEYINMKSNVLSPSTIKGYRSLMSQYSERFMDMNLLKIENADIQTEINSLSVGRTPKTVRNFHGFISSVLGVFRPDMKIYTTLPKKVKNEPHIPSDEDVRRILEESKGTEYEIPIILACYGLRRSEICALTPEDIDGDVVHINKAVVLDENNEWVVKSTKTTESTRDIVIPEEITGKIREQGYIYKGHPNSILRFLDKTQKELGIPCFSLHKLRHYFASKMSAMHIPDADIMKMGGWKTDYVMKDVYRHAMEYKNKEAQKKASDEFKKILFNDESVTNP